MHSTSPEASEGGNRSVIGAELRVEVRHREITLLSNNSNAVYCPGCILPTISNRQGDGKAQES